MRNQTKRTPARAIKSFVAMMMVLCLLLGTVPMAFAASNVGTKSADITPSANKVYIKIAGNVRFSSGDLSGQGTLVFPAIGEVCQLVSDNWYTGSDGQQYYSVYYQNQRYNVYKSTVDSMIMSPEALDAYIKGTLWTATTFATLRKADGLVGDVRVHGLQLALQQLGYYPGDPDGDFGKVTHDAVAKFQRAKGLEADGSAGPLTQPVLYQLALGNTGSSGSSGSTGSSGTGSYTGTSGTLRTTASVNLREYATTESARLDVVPKSVNLSFTETYTPVGGVTWYKVTYRGNTGWLMGSYVTVTTGGASTPGSSGTPVASQGTLRTNVVVNLRKYASKSSALLGRVPKSVSLSYTDTYQSGSVTWYQVKYNGTSGWLMGTYVTVTSTTSSGSGSTEGGITSTEPAIGKATITKASTRIRVAPNGDKSGYVLAKGTVVDLLANPVMAGDYSWHKIRTSTGLVGYVRGDCCETSIGTPDSGSTTVTSDKTFIRLPAATILFTEETKPATGGEAVAAGTVLMMHSAQTYIKDGVEYCSLYYNDHKYNAVYSSVKGGVMTSTAAATYMENLLKDELPDSLKREYDHVGNVYVYALQSALKRLGLYTGALDGDFGAGTQAAVTNFQRKAKLTVDGYCGSETWAAVRAAIADLNNSGSTGGTTGNATTIAEFFAGATSVTKPTWDGDGVSLIKKNSYADVLDIATGKVFTIYRWSGGNHADCVPATANDTKTMCDIVSFTYRDSAPSAAHLENVIKVAKGQLSDNHAWPDFGGHVYGHDIGGSWDRRAALVRPQGSAKIYAVSIYGWPHGFEGDDAFARATFPDGKLFYEKNNFYGMMCLHFVGSKTHGGNAVSTEHQNNISTAYNWAYNNGYSSLCK